MIDKVLNIFYDIAQKKNFEILNYHAPECGGACIYLDQEKNIFRIKAMTIFEIEGFINNLDEMLLNEGFKVLLDKKITETNRVFSIVKR